MIWRIYWWCENLKITLEWSILAFFCSDRNMLTDFLCIFCLFWIFPNLYLFFSWIFDRDKLSNSLKLTVTMNEPSLHFCFNVLRFYFSVNSAVYFIVVMILILDIFEVTIILLNGALYRIFVFSSFFTIVYIKSAKFNVNIF